MRRQFLLSLFLPLLAASPAPTTAPLPPLLAEAHHLLSNLKDSQYTHKTNIDEQSGIYHCDCSGLICHLLKRTSPDLYKLLPHPSAKRPLAIHFYTAFSQADPHPSATPSWQRIDHLSDARPGDLLAWRRNDIQPGDDTGHIVLLDSPPTPAGPNVFSLTVIDSTASPHADDTRKPGQTGVGRGTLWIKVDDQGKPLGFRWKSNGPRFTELPIAIARPSREN